MALTIIGSGTITASGSEQALVTDTTGKAYVLVVDTANMALGDELILRIYTKVLSGSTERLAYVGNFQHVQSEPNKYSAPVPADVSFRATLHQITGSGKAYDWKVISL